MSYPSRSPVDIGALSGLHSGAAGINDAGTVVGYMQPRSGVQDAFRWTAGGGMQRLPARQK